MLPRWALGSSSTPRVALGSSRGPRWSGKCGPWPQTPGRAWDRPSSHGFTSDPATAKDHLSCSSHPQYSKYNVYAVRGDCGKSKGVAYLQYVPRELLWALLFCWEWECEWEDDSLPLELFAAWFACLCGC